MLKKYVILIMLSVLMLAPLRAQADVAIDGGGGSTAKTVSNIGAVALPLTVAATIAVKKDFTGAWQAALAAGSTYAVTQVVKELTQVPRPDGSDNLSFPSGHTSMSFAMASFLHCRYGYKFGIPAFGVATTVGVCRVLAKRHSVADVAAGAALGLAAGYIITTPFAAKHELSVAPYAMPEGCGMAASFTF